MFIKTCAYTWHGEECLWIPIVSLCNHLLHIWSFLIKLLKISVISFGVPSFLYKILASIILTTQNCPLGDQTADHLFSTERLARCKGLVEKHLSESGAYRFHGLFHIFMSQRSEIFISSIYFLLLFDLFLTVDLKCEIGSLKSLPTVPC